MKSTKRSLLLSTLSLIMCVAMLLGTTYAWFTDSVTSGRNKIVAGNLDVELTHTNAKVTNQKVQDATDLFGVALWEPGVIAWENLTVTNVGNLALKYALNLNVFDKNATTAGNDLTEVIKVAVIDGGFTATGDPVADRASAQAITTYESLKDFQKTGNLAGGDSTGDTFGVVLYWQPTDNDNLYNLKNGLASTDGQPLFVEFGVNLVATQDTVEADSFDNQYDKTAPLAVMSTPMTKKLANTESLKIVVPEEAESSVKEATVPAAVANAVFDKVFTNSTTSDKSLTLVLNVEEKSKTETTFNYEIDMDAVIKEVSGSTVIKNETKSVNDLGLTFTDFVEVQMNIEPGLDNVKVKHNGNDMTEVENKEAIPAEGQNAAGYFNYAKASGLTKLWIKSFSPFVITGEKPTAPTVSSAQALVDAIANPSVGDVILVASGEYNFAAVDYSGLAPSSAYITISRPITIKAADNTNKPIFNIPSTSNGEPPAGFFAHGVEIKSNNVTLENLKFSVDPANVSTGNLMQIDQKAKSGTVDEKYYSNITINGCEFEGSDHCIATMGKDVTIKNCILDESTADDQGNIIYVWSSAGTLTIQNNTFKGKANNKHGISFYQQNDVNTVEGSVLIDGNTFTDVFKCVLFEGALLYKNVSSFKISNNTFNWKPSSQAITFDKVANGSEKFTIIVTENTFNGTGTHVRSKLTPEQLVIVFEGGEVVYE